MTLRILAVLVRYQMSLEQSHTLAGLSSALASGPGLAGSCKGMIWDNTPQPIAHAQLPPAFLYRHSHENNATRRHHGPIRRMIAQPWRLLPALARRGSVLVHTCAMLRTAQRAAPSPNPGPRMRAAS